MRPLVFDPSDHVEKSQALIAQLAPRASPPEASPPPHAQPSPPSRAAPRPRARAPRPRAPAPRPTPPPPPIVRNEPVPSAIPTPPPRPTPPTEAQPTPRPPAETDLSSYIAARRNARGEAPATSESNAPNAPPAESEKGAAQPHRHRQPRLEQDAYVRRRPEARRRDVPDPAHRLRRRGVLLQRAGIRTSAASHAQIIEVRKGTNPDIRTAVIRKIIEIIRAHEPGDFTWVSRRASGDYVVGASGRQRRARGLHDARDSSAAISASPGGREPEPP